MLTVKGWFEVLDPPDKRFASKEVEFIVSEVALLFFSKFAEIEANQVKVVSDYPYKGNLFPVYFIEVPDKVMVWFWSCRGRWRVSVKTPEPVEDVFLGLFAPDKVVKPCTEFEGRAGKFFSPYAQDPRRFTVQLGSDYDLYAFFLMLSEALGLRTELAETRYHVAVD